MILNFGHTVAHALETKIGYGKLPHGEAVAIGMVIENEMSEKAGISPVGSTDRIRKLLKFNGLPVMTGVSFKELGPIMKNDKKNMSGTLNAVFLEDIGHAGLYKMSIDEFINMRGESK